MWSCVGWYGTPAACRGCCTAAAASSWPVACPPSLLIKKGTGEVATRFVPPHGQLEPTDVGSPPRLGSGPGGPSGGAGGAGEPTVQPASRVVWLETFQFEIGAAAAAGSSWRWQQNLPRRSASPAWLGKQQLCGCAVWMVSSSSVAVGLFGWWAVALLCCCAVVLLCCCAVILLGGGQAAAARRSGRTPRCGCKLGYSGGVAD